MKDYVKNKIMESQVKNIPCSQPGCKHVLSYDEVWRQEWIPIHWSIIDGGVGENDRR